MPYVEDITEPLISTLNYVSGLPPEKLAGHAANLEFWLSEVQHALDVIDGYGDRFKKLQDGQRSAEELSGLSMDRFLFGKPIRPGISDYDLKQLRRRLIDAVSVVLRRCYREGLVSANDLEEYCVRFDLDRRELKRAGGPGLT